MGSSGSGFTREQNEAASAELLSALERQGVDSAGGIDKTQWNKVFEDLDAKGTGAVSRKECFSRQGTTIMYDSVPKRYSANMTLAEWSQAFEALDSDKDGMVFVQEWLERRQVRLGFVPIDRRLGVPGPMYNWGIAVGVDSYEVAPPLNLSATEMAVVGPKGIVALGKFTHRRGATEKWLDAHRNAAKVGGSLDNTWLEEQGEPRSRPEGAWQDEEHAGWTMRTDEEIAVWISQWVVEHPSYRAIDPFGRECNDQTFALAFISWLIGDSYSRMTDNTKGRTAVYGTLALLAGVGIMYAVKDKRA